MRIVEEVRKLRKFIMEKPDLVVETCEEILKIEDDTLVRTFLEYVKALAKARVLEKARSD